MPDVLLKQIVCYSGEPALVVSVGTNKGLRGLLRAGVDDAERARFGGIGLTVREAERALCGEDSIGASHFRSSLTTREASGLFLATYIDTCSRTRPPDSDDSDDEDEFDIDRVRPGECPFMLERVRAIVAYGANVNARWNHLSGSNALHFATRAGFEETAKLLLAAGAEVDAQVMREDAAGPTPLAWAFRAGLGDGDDEEMEMSDHYGRRLRVARLLVDRGANIALAEASSTQNFDELICARMFLLEKLQDAYERIEDSPFARSRIDEIKKEIRELDQFAVVLMDRRYKQSAMLPPPAPPVPSALPAASPPAALGALHLPDGLAAALQQHVSGLSVTQLIGLSRFITSTLVDRTGSVSDSD